MSDQELRLFHPAEQSGEPEDWSAEEIEQAYRRALGAIEAFEAADAEHFGPAATAHCRVDLSPHDSAGEPRSEAQATVVDAEAAADVAPRVTPRQIIEAVLFVGSSPVTSLKLCGVLRDEFDVEFIERTIDELNERYRTENRPYEIRPGEDGYRMVLRDEFARVAHRVFGLGPKEVRLSQEALEVVALVAYRQPVTRGQVEEAIGRNPSALLNQLVRRELVLLERGDGAKEVLYRTTKRFLQVFGLRSLDDLPQAETLNFK